MVIVLKSECEREEERAEIRWKLWFLLHEKMILAGETDEGDADGWGGWGYSV